MNESPPIRSLSTFEGLDETERELTISKLIVEVHDWLAGAGDNTPVWEFSSVRAYAADIASIVSRLQLSTELRLDALMVLRLAERAVGKAVRRGQAAKEIGSNATNNRHMSGGESLPSPTPYVGGGTVAHAIYQMTDGVSDAQFSALLKEARAEGKLARAYVARKTAAAAVGKKIDSRKPLVDEARDLAEALRKVVVRLKKVHDDDRLEKHKADVAARLRYYVAEAEGVCASLRKTLDKE